MIQSFYFCIQLMSNRIQASNKDKLSSIQNSLHEMKEEVSQYLKKSNIDAVPPVLRVRNYLLMNYMQSLKQRNPLAQKSAIKRQLSTQKMENDIEVDGYQAIRESIDHSYQQKKVKHQINLSGSNYKSGANCFLPNIGQVKLDFQDKFIPSRISSNGKLQGKSLQINQERQEQILKVRRYLKGQNNPQKDNSAKTARNHISDSISRRLFDALDRQCSKKNHEQHLSFSQQLPFNMPDIVQEYQTRARMRKQQARINSMLAEQRKQSIFKRKRLVKSISNKEEQSSVFSNGKYENHLTPKKSSRESRYRPKLTEKDQYSPWQQQNLAESFYIQQMQP